MSNTLQQLTASSFKFGKSGLGVLTTEQALNRVMVDTKSLVVISSYDHKVFFFSDDHIFGYQVLPKSFVSVSGGFPTTVTPRESVPDGKVNTIQKLIEVFYKDQRQILTIEELVDFLDNQIKK